jgi:hypothetical protein
LFSASVICVWGKRITSSGKSMFVDRLWRSPSRDLPDDEAASHY